MLLRFSRSWKIRSHMISVTNLINDLERVVFFAFCKLLKFCLSPALEEKIPDFQCAKSHCLCACLDINIECEIGRKRKAARGRTHIYISSVMLFAPYSSSPARVCMCPCGLVAGGRIDQIVTSSTFIKVLFIFSGLTFLIKRCVFFKHKHPWTYCEMLWMWVKNSRAALFVLSGKVSAWFSMFLVDPVVLHTREARGQHSVHRFLQSWQSFIFSKKIMTSAIVRTT